ncbi:MAG: ABC-2 family transporter protein [Spirochaetes bacterium]|nr:ABC-2 family transporter protein [Spirochaetota bacterium]MBU1082098.1 ABC-2 family transporter protein [Spirochaetota bacterium]
MGTIRMARPLGRIRAYARFMGAAFAFNLKATLEYRVNFVLQFFGMLLNNAAFAAFWMVLIERTGAVGGYGFSDVMLVWAFVSTSFGLAHIVFGNVRHLGRIVMEGGLDVYLLQPKDVWVNVLSSRTIVSAWGDFAYGFIVLALTSGTDLQRFALFAALAVPGALIFAATFAAAESLAFFMGNSSAVSSALTEFMLSFSLYPEGIYGPGMRWALYSIVPSGFVAFMPLRVFKSLDWGLVPVLCLVAAVYVGLSYGLFRLGLGRYESGNRMDARV